MFEENVASTMSVVKFQTISKQKLRSFGRTEGYVEKHV